MAGTYAISGGFDGFTSAQASFAGTVSLAQASRESPALTGNFNVTATIGGDVFLLTGSLQGATVTTARVISFASGDGSAVWSFSGTVSGTTVTGRHTLSDGTDSFSGNWSMQRTGNLAAMRPAKAPTGDLAALVAALR